MRESPGEDRTWSLPPLCPLPPGGKFEVSLHEKTRRAGTCLRSSCFALGPASVTGTVSHSLPGAPCPGNYWPDFPGEDTDSRWETACPRLSCQQAAGFEPRTVWLQRCAFSLLVTCCPPWPRHTTTSKLGNRHFSGAWGIFGNPKRTTGQAGMARVLRASEGR